MNLLSSSGWSVRMRVCFLLVRIDCLRWPSETGNWTEILKLRYPRNCDGCLDFLPPRGILSPWKVPCERGRSFGAWLVRPPVSGAGSETPMDNADLLSDSQGPANCFGGWQVATAIQCLQQGGCSWQSADVLQQCGPICVMHAGDGPTAHWERISGRG